VGLARTGEPRSRKSTLRPCGSEIGCVAEETAGAWYEDAGRFNARFASSPCRTKNHQLHELLGWNWKAAREAAGRAAARARAAVRRILR
jgi:hypothetical protein